MAVVELIDVSKRFHGNVLFDSASLSIAEGRTYAIVGPNGSGKSVLFKMICGFQRPDLGEIRIDRRFLSEKRTFPADFGVIIDGPAYLPFETGLENLLRLTAIRKLVSDIDVRETMRAVGLDPDLRERVRRYSLGMKQKLALAQALMERPKVLLLDEPFNALDTPSVDRAMDLLLDQKRSGTTIIFTSHDRSHVDRLSDEVVVVAGGKLVPEA
ncbi:ABC transporter ATP-binding protein [Galbitalea soli]|uniref:ABC transporter ATP-binding protein n=1 Tax=Galbitalea soli TaxID=1268042 RepID=A0A7C9TSS2_9MICO|nr:ABC transporter ATP-binding protein [Galbitalea soli]NEM92399.1 ABC transporter ATP-binding protein [Galbitalea soli]NYJ29433.1 ABC-2 type transport system ATP-binding protein [Galbitalea soli]